jgi:hypothetical protein
MEVLEVCFLAIKLLLGLRYTPWIGIDIVPQMWGFVDFLFAHEVSATALSYGRSTQSSTVT